MEDDDKLALSAPVTAKDVVEAPGATAPVIKQRDEGNNLWGYDLQIGALKEAAKAVAPESEEDRRKREWRERSRKTIAAVSDGLSALANLYFTSQYAPNAYTGQNSQLGKVSGRIDALRAERDANRDRYNNIMVKLGDVHNAKASALRAMRAQQKAQELADLEEKRKADLHPWAVKAAQAQAAKDENLAGKAGYEMGISQLKFENTPTELENKNKKDAKEIELTGARIRTEGSKQNANNAAAQYSRTKAASVGQEKVYGHFLGKAYYNQRDFDEAVHKALKDYNERNGHYVTEKKAKYNPSTGKNEEVEEERFVPAIPLKWSRRTSSGQNEEVKHETSYLAAELEYLLDQESVDDTPLSKQAEKNNNNTPPSRRK